MAELSLWTCLLEAPVEDMLPMAYVEAPKTKNFFLGVISLGPIFLVLRNFSEDSDGWLFLCKIVVFQETYLLAMGRWLACCFCFVSAS